MQRRTVAPVLAAASVSATAAVAVWGFWIDPEPGFRWLFLGGFLPALWAYVEVAQPRGVNADVGASIMVFHRYTIAFAGCILASEHGLRLLVHEGLVDPSWLSAGLRFRGLMLGTGMAVFGNLLPTLRSPWPFHQEPFAWQRVHRFVGWTLVVAGLGVIGAWLFLPLDPARQFSIVICGTACTLALGRKLGSLAARSFGRR